MQTSNRILDDLAKVANGAVATLAGVKDEVEAMIRQQVERYLADGNLVRCHGRSREERPRGAGKIGSPSRQTGGPDSRPGGRQTADSREKNGGQARPAQGPGRQTQGLTHRPYMESFQGLAATRFFAHLRLSRSDSRFFHKYSQNRPNPPLHGFRP